MRLLLLMFRILREMNPATLILSMPLDEQSILSRFSQPETFRDFTFALVIVISLMDTFPEMSSSSVEAF